MKGRLGERTRAETSNSLSLSVTPGFLELFPWEKGMLLCKGMPWKFKQPFIVPSHLDGISFFVLLS